MLFIYNSALTLLLLLLAPVLLLLGFASAKYRNRLPARLGCSLAKRLHANNTNTQKGSVIWLHALSVGEVSSCLPLVQGLRQQYSQARIVVSVTTRSGHQVASKILAQFVDAILPSPLDIPISVQRFIKAIEPDLFILIETDFWPNWLHQLKRTNTPLFLVNGRVSKKSIAQYKRFSFFFRPLFDTFTMLAMQTATDAANMAQLGIAPDKVATLGNLKFDFQPSADTTTVPKATQIKEDFRVPLDARIILCGSTHPGEEEILFQAFKILQQTHSRLLLVIAPRNIGRSEEIITLAGKHTIQATRRSDQQQVTTPLLLLDSIGELSTSYGMATLAFIGGSLVPAGGHNPLEPAANATPILFGPHMDDFEEISQLLVQEKAAIEVLDTFHVAQEMERILTDPQLRESMADNAARCVRENNGVVEKHLDIIGRLLPH